MNLTLKATYILLRKEEKVKARLGIEKEKIGYKEGEEIQTETFFVCVF